MVIAPLAQLWLCLNPYSSVTLDCTSALLSSTTMTRQGLLLNETSLSALPESKRAVFVHEWLRRLHGTLPSVARTDVFKDTQKTLVAQLMKLAEDGSPGPPARVLIAKCLTTVFTVGDTFLLFDTINK